jgi:hypothetical protein
MRVPGKLVLTAAVAAALTVGMVGGGLAQDATPMADMGDMNASPGNPNHIHDGTCQDLDPNPAYVLANLEFPAWVADLSGSEGGEVDSIPDAAAFGGAPIPVAVATTEVPVGLSEIISGGHAINVHDANDISVYIACGNVGGVPDDRGDLFIGLDEQNGSGYNGVAWLHDNGSSTTVTIFLNNNGVAADVAVKLDELQKAAASTPEAAAATPEAAAPAATPEAVEGTPVTT